MRAVLLVAICVAVSGCMAQAPAPAATSHTHEAEFVAPFSFTAEECEVGGFVSSYPGTTKLAGIWQTADIREELGNPIRDSLGMPVTGPLFGNWHIGFECASATGAGETLEAFEFGWVGQMVEAPAWDTGGADQHFLLTGLAFDKGPIGEGLRAATTADITHVQEVTLDWLTPKDLPRSTINARFVDVERGVYESWSDMEPHGEMPDRVVRFWWQVPADGSEGQSGHQHSSGTMEGQYHPLYFDMHLAAGPRMLTPPAGGVELASHNMLKMEHGPVLAQPCATVVYDHPSVTFTTGAVFEEIVLREVWTH